jgi:hypothetical protein
MPIVNRSPESVFAQDTGSIPEPQIDVAPDTGSIFGAAFRQNNLIGSGITHFGNFGGIANDTAPNYSAWDDIKGTPYEEHWHAFATSNNARYTEALKRQIDQEDRDRRTLDSGGWTSTLADLSAGILDPTILIPVGGEVAKGLEGYRLLSTFGRTARAGAIATTAQETGLQLTQETRPLSESATNVGFGTVLSGVLGTGAAALLSKPERDLAKRGFDNLVSEYGNPANSSVGAAQAAQSLGIDALTVAGGAANKIADTSQFLNPGLRLNFSPSPIARQVGQELAEGSVYQVGHAEGLTTGPAVDRLAGMQERARTADGMGKLDQAFMDMKKAETGIDNATLAQASARIQRIGMSFDEFDQAVGRAMRNEDVGDNEFVSRAARDLRSSIVHPFFEDGKAVGLYDEGDKAAFAPSYFPRQYRTKVLIANEPEIKAQWTDYMGGLITGKYREAHATFSAAQEDMDRAISDLGLSPAKREQALAAVQAEHDALHADNPDHADRMAQLDEARATEAAARQSGDKAELRKAQEARRAVKKEGGDAFKSFVDAADKLKARIERLGMTDKAGSAAMRDELVAAKADAQRAFLDRWEIKHLGEGIDPAKIGKVDFSNMAREIVDEIYAKLTGRDYGATASVAPEYMTPIKRGPVKERTLPIPDKMLTAQGVLEDRASDVLRRYSRTLAADVELTRKFGSPRLDDQLKRIAEEYDKLRQGVTDPKALKALHARQKADQRDIEGLRDLIRGTYKREANSNGFARASRVASHFNFIRSLGGVIISSLSDMARPAMVHGLGRFMGEGVAPLLKNFEAVKLSVKEAKLAGSVVDRVLQHRIMALSSMGDPFERGTPIERAMEGMSRFASKWTGMGIWNDSWKAISSILSQNRILSGEADARTLAFLGIDPDMATAIRAEFKAHGEVMDGVHVANTEHWTDPEAVRAFRAAVGKDVDSTIVTPGFGDAPLLSHTPMGRLLLQFRSYTLASHQKVVIRGLQEGKGKFVSGMVGMTALGMLSATLKAWRAGENRWEKFKKASENPGYLIGEGLDNAGTFALPFDFANTTEKLGDAMHFSFNPIKTPMMAAGQWAVPNASMQGKSIRYSSRGPLGALLGPTAGLVEDTFQAGAGVSDKLHEGQPGHPNKVPRTEQNAAWRLLPFNSFYGMREAIQAITGDSPYLHDEPSVPTAPASQPTERPAAVDAN